MRDEQAHRNQIEDDATYACVNANPKLESNGIDSVRLSTLRCDKDSYHFGTTTKHLRSIGIEAKRKRAK